MHNYLLYLFISLVTCVSTVQGGTYLQASMRCLKTNKLDSAIIYSNIALKQHSVIDSTIKLYEVQLDVYQFQKKNKESFAIASKLLNIAGHSHNYNLAVHTYLQLANRYYYTANLKKIEHYLNLCKANTLYKQELKGDNLFNYYHTYSVFYLLIHNTKKHQLYNALALNVAQQLGNNKYIIKKLTDIAWYNQASGNFALSNAYIRKAQINSLYAIDSSTYHYINLLQCENNLAMSSSPIASVQKTALQALIYATLHNELSHSNKALSTLTTVYEAQHNYTAAQLCCNKMLSITNASNNNVGTEAIYNKKYEIAVLQNNYKTAIQFLDSAYIFKIKNNQDAQRISIAAQKEQQQLHNKLALDKLTYQNNTNYNRYLFILITLMLLLTVGIIIFYYSKQIAKNKLQQALLNQQLLRSQMNPHFTFNALNTLQYFILNKNEDKALNYLASFSKLMRYSLNQSLQEKIALIDELNFLQLYMNLECLRYGNKNTFSVNVAPNINTKEVKIPQMLLQPFIENAFNHGLKHKKENGHVSLTIHAAMPTSIVCTITDNGVGRAAAVAFNTLKKHESKALVIVQERIYLFNKLERNSVQYSVEIIDLLNPQQQPLGTTVNISIPHD
jgi:sensor histidine kinase YesM